MKNAIILLLLIAACGPKNEEPNKFSDEKLITIYELQDRRDTKALLPLLKAKKESHRIAAAMAFASIQDTIAIPYLNQMLQIDQDPMPRRAAAFALGQIGSTKALGILIKAFDQELFPANRRYVMEAIGKCGDSSTIKLFEENEYQDSALQMGWAYGVFRLGQRGYTSEVLNYRMMRLLNDENPAVASLAGHYVYRSLRKDSNLALVDSLIRIARYDEVKDRLGLLKEDTTAKEQLNGEWTVEYNKLNNYQKAKKLLNASNDNPKVIEFCYRIIKNNSDHIVIKTAAMEKFIEARNDISYSMWPNPTMNDGLIAGLESGDMALQSLAAIELQDHKYFKALWSDKNQSPKWILLLKDIKEALVLPRQAETYIDITKAIHSLELTFVSFPFVKYQPEYNHPIDWNFVKTIPADQRVIIETNKGSITLQLFVEDAPGTTSNFLKLVDSNFYDGKYFHRVVPQFVVQGGCPRGDGWGSLDWTQRSEFSNYQTYETGTVGVASAGKDTEGVQFFITHCPTPHLDGRYSIFARVVSGMDVVNKMEVGDRMISIKRL